MEKKPLEGIRVIDASSVLAGPAVGMFLAELGAHVIKIEHPEHGDVTRNWKLASEDPKSTISAYFCCVNYKKEYISIDLASESGLDQFNKLIDTADIFVSNFKNGDAEKFGIEDDVLLKRNPRLILGKITGYGDDSDRVAFDLILQAETGYMFMNGTPESGPVKLPVAIVDILASHHLREGILLALYEREKTGKGKAVTVSLYDAGLSGLVNQGSNYLMAGLVPQRIGSLNPNISPYGEQFKTKDGATITFAIGSDKHFANLCKTLALAELVEDERFVHNQNRVTNRTELAKIISEKVQTWDCKELLGILEKLKVPAGKIKDLEEVFADAEAQALVREEIIDGVATKRVTSVVF